MLIYYYGFVGLATLKVQNMLDDYGESPKDLYPSRHKGLPAHKQDTDTFYKYVIFKLMDSSAPAQLYHLFISLKLLYYICSPWELG